MTLNTIKQSLPDYAKDIKINLGQVLRAETALGLTQKQIYGTALACALAVENQEIVTAILADAQDVLGAQDITAVKAAVTIMAMNNVYYRFVHLVSDPEYSQLPAKLRMMFMANPGVEKIDFEVYSLAISALNGCGMCLDAHSKTLTQASLNKEAIQTAVRISAVIHALHATLKNETLVPATAG